jgi:hypothetical protein
LEFNHPKIGAILSPKSRRSEEPKKKTKNQTKTGANSSEKTKT